MKLYRIRNKQTGKYFVSNSHCWTSWCNSSGAFFKKIDTVRNHIDNLCYTWKYRNGRFPNPYNPENTYFKEWYERISYHPERLDIFEVVVNDVTINGETVISAADIMQANDNRGAA